MPQVVAGCVCPVLSKFLAESEIRRSVQTRYETFDDRSRDEIQAGNLGQNGGIEKAVCDFCGHFILTTGSRLPFKQAAQDLVCIQPVRFGVKIQQNAMSQDGDC